MLLGTIKILIPILKIKYCRSYHLYCSVQNTYDNHNNIYIFVTISIFLGIIYMSDSTQDLQLNFILRSSIKKIFYTYFLFYYVVKTFWVVNFQTFEVRKKYFLRSQILKKCFVQKISAHHEIYVFFSTVEWSLLEIDSISFWWRNGNFIFFKSVCL